MEWPQQGQNKTILTIHSEYDCNIVSNNYQHKLQKCVTYWLDY